MMQMLLSHTFYFGNYLVR